MSFFKKLFSFNKSTATSSNSIYTNGLYSSPANTGTLNLAGSSATKNQQNSTVNINPNGGNLYINPIGPSNGSVAIGTNSPTSGNILTVNGTTDLNGTLSVNGNANISGSVTSNSLTVNSGATLQSQTSLSLNIVNTGGQNAWSQINLKTSGHSWSISTSGEYEQNNLYFQSSNNGKGFNVDQNGNLYVTGQISSTPQSTFGSFSNGGYSTLPGGLILQWGVLLAQDSIPSTWTFPTPFPNAPLTVQITNASQLTSPSPSWGGVVQLQSLSSSSATVIGCNTGAVGNVIPVTVLAIGY